MNSSSFQITQKHPTRWDIRFLNLCDLIATWSEDNSRKVGAVIVGEFNEIRSTGYNGLPRNVSASIDHRHEQQNGEKYHWYEHAERNAIFNAARVGIPLQGTVMYTNLFPCAECARAIVQSGIVRLKTYSPPENDKQYDRSFEVSQAVLNEGGVEVICYLKQPAPTNHTH